MSKASKLFNQSKPEDGPAAVNSNYSQKPFFVSEAQEVLTMPFEYIILAHLDPDRIGQRSQSIIQS